MVSQDCLLGRWRWESQQNVGCCLSTCSCAAQWCPVPIITWPPAAVMRSTNLLSTITLLQAAFCMRTCCVVCSARRGGHRWDDAATHCNTVCAHPSHWHLSSSVGWLSPEQWCPDPGNGAMHEQAVSVAMPTNDSLVAAHSYATIHLTCWRMFNVVISVFSTSKVFEVPCGVC
jgi:hypothetical protein